MSTPVDSPKAPAGWYPAENGKNRYWDGEQWLDIPEPATSVFRTPKTSWSRISKRNVVIVAASTLVLAAALGVGLAVKSAADAQAAQELAAEEKRAEEAAERKAERQAAAAEAQAEEEAAALAAAEEMERALRAEAVAQIEQSVAAKATEDVTSGLIDGPVLRVSCSPVAGGSLDDLTETTTVFECFMSRVDNPDGTSSGYYYNATINWDSGSYTYGFGRP